MHVPGSKQPVTWSLTKVVCIAPIQSWQALCWGKIPSLFSLPASVSFLGCDKEIVFDPGSQDNSPFRRGLRQAKRVPCWLKSTIVYIAKDLLKIEVRETTVMCLQDWKLQPVASNKSFQTLALKIPQNFCQIHKDTHKRRELFTRDGSPDTGTSRLALKCL